MTAKTRKKTAVIAVGITALIASPIAFARADIRITEIMYNAAGSDEGKEYVEILNAGAERVDMTTLKFRERGRKHSLRRGIGNPVLEKGDIAVIVRKPEEFTKQYSFSGTVLDSGGFMLNNTESTVEILSKDQVLRGVTYTKQDGANGDGNALHVSGDGTLSAGPPTIGSVDGTKPRGTRRESASKPPKKVTAKKEAPPSKPAIAIPKERVKPKGGVKQNIEKPERPRQNERAKQDVAPPETERQEEKREESAIDGKEKETSVISKMILWIALLFGIIALALAPLFIARSEEKKSGRATDRKQKNEEEESSGEKE